MITVCVDSLVRDWYPLENDFEYDFIGLAPVSRNAQAVKSYTMYID